MKKENIYKFLYIVAALLVVGFAIAFGVGGRDFAKHMLAKVEKGIDSKSRK